MVEAICIAISIVVLYCNDRYDKTSKIRYVVASGVLAIPMMILVLKEELW
jgi:hypothetical protein